MAYLMVGYDTPLFAAHYPVLLLFSDKDDLNGIQHILLRNHFPAALYGIDRCLVDHICKVGAHGSARCKGYRVEIHGLVYLNLSGVNLKGLYTSLKIGLFHYDSSVETPGTQKRLVKGLGAVCGSEDKYSLCRIKAVHLGKKLI